MTPYNTTLRYAMHNYQLSGRSGQRSITNVQSSVNKRDIKYQVSNIGEN
jgi:hypothetical protein